MYKKAKMCLEYIANSVASVFRTPKIIFVSLKRKWYQRQMNSGDFSI